MESVHDADLLRALHLGQCVFYLADDLLGRSLWYCKWAVDQMGVSAGADPVAEDRSLHYAYPHSCAAVAESWNRISGVYRRFADRRPQLMFGAVIQLTTSFAVADVSIALAGFPSVNYAAETVVTHLIDFGTTRFEMGYASAIATVLFMIMVGTNLLVQKLLRRVGE
jgi:hypothetical protein